MRISYKMINKRLAICLCIVNILVLLVGCKEKSSNKDPIKTVLELDELVSLSQETNDEILYSQLPKIVDEMKNFSDEDVLRALKDDKVSDTTKHIIIEQISQINNGEGIKTQLEFEELLTDNTVSQSNKIAIIHTLDFESIESFEILKDIVYLENSAITTNALKKIKRTSPIAALNISNDIIANYDNYGEYQIKAAVMTKSDYLRDMSVTEFENVSEKEIDEYISFCIKKFESATDGSFSDAMIFSLMNINHIKAVRAIVFHDSIDNLLKTSCVQKNYQTFSKILKLLVSDEELECIIKAMEIAPIKEVGVMLKETDLSKTSYLSSELSVLIDKIKNNGTEADQKWVIAEQQFNWE